MVSSQGVRQLCPEGVFTSAPAGSDSNRTAAVGGDEFRKFRLGTDAEQAATVNPHAMTAMTRLIITPPLWRLRAAIPRTRPCRTAREGSTHRKQSARYGLKCDGDKVQWGYGYPADALATSTAAVGKPVSARREPRAGGAAEIQRVVENAPRRPDVTNTACLVSCDTQVMNCRNACVVVGPTIGAANPAGTRPSSTAWLRPTNCPTSRILVTAGLE
jgi:hypothetical protein